MPDGRLQVTDSQGRRVVRLDRPVFVIGRRTTADLQLVSADVSREHAEIVRDDTGRYLLRDRASRYGTFVNGEQIAERPLMHGDNIRLGHSDNVELVFLADEDASSVLRSASTDASDLAQMAAILNGLRALGSGRVLDEVLTLVIDSALDVTKAERGFIMMPDFKGELEFKNARGRGGLTLPGTQFTTSSKIPREVFETGNSRLVGDLLDGDLAGAHGGTIAIGIRHVLCVPLRVFARGGGNTTEVIGVLYLDGRERGTLLSSATCRRSKPLPRKRRSRSRAPGSTPTRPRKRKSTATCGSPPTSSGRCCPKAPASAPASTWPRHRCRAGRSEAISTTTWT